MLCLPAITLSIALLGRLSPGPAAAPYRHTPAAVEATMPHNAEPPLVTIITQAAPGSLPAFSKPQALVDWQAEWTNSMAGKAFDVVGFHTKNAPIQALREIPINLNLAPAILKGGGAAVTISFAY